jgi:polyhydroxybutyrate depolymerase
MKTRLAFMLFVLLCIVASIATSRNRNDAHGENGFSNRTVDIDGLSRRYLVRTPANGKPPTAIVVMLHGHTGSAERLIGSDGNAAPYRQWNAIADREGLLLIAPQGIDGGDGKFGWNDCRADADSNPRSDDVAFIAAIVAASHRDYRVASNRMYIIGSSNGGQMALRMAIERPEMVTAAAAIIASMPARSECAVPTRFVPMVFINGTEDPLMPYEGGRVAKDTFQRGGVLSTNASIEFWAKLSGNASTPSVVLLPNRSIEDRSRVFREVHATRGNRPTLMLYRIEGGGHLEPSCRERYPHWLSRWLGKQNADIEMADEVWTFFRSQ